MYNPSRLYAEFFIAGFKYYEGPFVLGKLKTGKKLELVPEFDNPHDPNAVAIYRKGKKIGFVPRVMNETLAQLLRFGHGDVFECRIMQIDKEAAPYNQVRVGIYVVDKTAAEKPAE